MKKINLVNIKGYKAFLEAKTFDEFLESLQEKFEKIVLETEPDSLSEIAARRLQFYQRNGFEIVEKNYLQPSYGEGKSSLHLFLMANFEPENVETLIQEIHKIVYEI